MSWKKKFLSVASIADEKFDEIKAVIKQRLGTNASMQIVPYRSYGTPNRIYVKGRVLEDKRIKKATDGDSLFINILNMYKRFESDEVPGIEVALAIKSETHTTVTDHEGYFIFNINPAEPLVTEQLYYTLPLELTDGNNNVAVTATAEIMIPPADAEYGIISDIDDTIIKTGATSLLEMGKTVLLSNAKTRLPYKAVSEFYKGLQLGRNGKRNNPFFYVSSSPWNLYDLIIDFMDIHSIPHGPLLLRDFGIRSETFMTGDYLGHKFKEIKQVFEIYPNLNFILIGDSGEEDPIIYYEVVKHFPGRVLAVYIRDVNHTEKKKIAEDISVKLALLNVPMLLTEHSAEAAAHAYKAGFIFKEAVESTAKDNG